MKIHKNKPIARAAARDEADRQMRAAGRTVWTDEDWNLAVRTYNRILYDVATCAADRQAS